MHYGFSQWSTSCISSSTKLLFFSHRHPQLAPYFFFFNLRQVNETFPGIEVHLRHLTEADIPPFKAAGEYFGDILDLLINESKVKLRTSHYGFVARNSSVFRILRVNGFPARPSEAGIFNSNKWSFYRRKWISTFLMSWMRLIISSTTIAFIITLIIIYFINYKFIFYYSNLCVLSLFFIFIH
jgi:hypothetical protein